MHQDSNGQVHTGIPSTNILLSVVVPVYNEEEVLPIFNKRLYAMLNTLDMRTEVVYINDGSTDNTLRVMQAFQKEDPNTAIIDLSRNFGKEIAVTAGLDHANGDIVVIIDADLQDPPELISEFIKQWEDGYDVVYGKRITRSGETVIKKVTAYVFYRVIKKFSRVYIPEDTGDFRLLSRRCVDSLKYLREQHRFMKGLFAWIGYSQKAVPYRRDPRYRGQTKWNYLKLWDFALEGFTSFTIAPLKIATYLGVATAIAGFIYAVFVICKTLIYGDPVKGYPSLMVVILFLGGIQLLTIGILGEYLGRIFNETKQRPLYFINEHKPSAASQSQTIKAP